MMAFGKAASRWADAVKALNTVAKQSSGIEVMTCYCKRETRIVAAAWGTVAQCSSGVVEI